MGIIGKNDLCHCGSKLKYEQCCLKSDFIIIDAEETMKNLSGHEITFGVKELALAELEQCIVILSKEHVNVTELNTYLLDLYELSNSPDMDEVYVKIHKEIMEAENRVVSPQVFKQLKVQARSLPSLTKNEKFILRTMMLSNIYELQEAADLSEVDYDAMKVLTEFCYLSILKGVPDLKTIASVTLYVDPNGTKRERLVEFELELTDKELSWERDLFTKWVTVESSN